MIKKLGSYSSSAAVAQGMMMLFTFAAARGLGPEQFGFLAGGYALAGLTAFAFNWGFDTWMLKDRRSLEAPGDWAGRILSIKLILGLAWGALLVSAAPMIRPDIYSPALMLVVVLDIWFDSALNTNIAALNIRGQFSAISGLLLLSRFIRLTGAVILLLSGGARPILFALVRLSGVVVAVIIAAGLLRPRFLSGNMPVVKQVLREASAFGLSDLLVMIYMQADVSILTFMKGSTAAGLYSPASGLVNAVFVVPASVFSLIVPVLARQFHSQPSRLAGSFTRLIGGYLLMGLGLMAGMFFLGRWAVDWLLGPRYALTGFLLALLSPILFLKALGFGCAALLVAVGWQKQRLLPQFASALLNIGLNIWLIPRLGIPGVGLVYVISEFVLTLGYGYLVARWFYPVKYPQARP